MTLSVKAQDFGMLKAQFLLADLHPIWWGDLGARWLFFTRDVTYSNRPLTFHTKEDTP